MVLSSVVGKMSQYQLIQKLFPTFMMIGVIFVAGFLKSSIKEEKIRNENRRVAENRVQRENALLERERFLQQHQQFLLTFLEYEGQCERIHSLVYRDPNGVREVNPRPKCCKAHFHMPGSHIQPGDRAPLNYATVYVFLSILGFLFVRAVIDVSKEIKSPEQATTKFSLKDYASSSRRCSEVRRDSRVFGLFSVPSIDNTAEIKKSNPSPTRKRSSFSTSSGRRTSLAQYLLKGKAISHTNLKKFDAIIFVSVCLYFFFFLNHLADLDDVKHSSFESVTEE